MWLQRMEQSRGRHCLPRGKICNDRAGKGGKDERGVKAVLSDGQGLVLIQLRRVLVVVCSVTAVNRELGKKDENLQSLCEEIDGKAKTRAVGKKEKRSLGIIFLLCVQSEQN